MTILIVLLVSYFLMVDHAYSQQKSSSITKRTTTDSGPSQQRRPMSSMWLACRRIQLLCLWWKYGMRLRISQAKI